MPWTIPNLVLHDKPVSLANMRSHGRKHVDGRRASPLLAGPAFQRRLEFPDRRGSRPTTVPPLFEFKEGLSTKPVDGDLTQPTLPERAQTRSRYRRSCRRVEPALIK
jgi:hypothetical protein